MCVKDLSMRVPLGGKNIYLYVKRDRAAAEIFISKRRDL